LGTGRLQAYDWPGNVRELQHALERACIVAADGRLRFDFPEIALKQRAKSLESNSIKHILTDREVRAFEANNIKAALTECNGKVYGSKGAALLLGMKPTTLNSRIKALGIKV
jgi:transcriptional regulator with GAF, ATPase, and Fis domain